MGAGAELAAGTELAQHYATEALRLHGGSQLSAELPLAQAALDWLLLRWSEPAISLPDLYQSGPSAIRDCNTARLIVTILEESGWLARIPQRRRGNDKVAPILDLRALTPERGGSTLCGHTHPNSAPASPLNSWMTVSRAKSLA